MKPPAKPIYDHYHAHVYFDQLTLEQATKLCEEAGKLFDVKVGRIHQKPVGPHPCWSCQLAFSSQEYEKLIPWLESNHQQLNILIHGLTGDDLKDHTEHASWIGEPQELVLSFFGVNL
ncbi:MAG: DOPA 4,5-dioxygenase family protein [Nostocaceae cyanobacterium]|nr:DOPA 4,5-dioxygenase family protein [Nostocaceae cyanobacterium]